MPSNSADPPPACPVDHKSREAWLKVAQSQSQPQPRPQPASQPSQTPLHPLLHPKITNTRLSTDRQVSSIPRGGGPEPSPQSGREPTTPEPPPQSKPTASPNAQTANPTTSPDGRWIYPSESQFYTALARKHRPEDVPEQSTIPSIIPIHNAVNERTWAEILGWERVCSVERNPDLSKQPGTVTEVNFTSRAGEERGQTYPRLVSFSGELKHRLTPRARMYGLLGYQEPFDRHDWVVERDAAGTRVEYVIDFYAGRGAGDGRGVSFYLDVRPKLNSWEGLRMRARKAVGW